MKQLKSLLFSFFLLITSFACRDISKDSYKQEIASWRETRIERLKSKTGWLNLAGLFWLKEGNNTFGSDSSNSVIFPSNAEPFYGNITKSGDSILLRTTANAIITIDGMDVSESLLKSDASGKPSLMESGSLAWFIIKRDERYGIRLRDYNHPRIAKLEHIPCFELSSDWRIEADFIPFDSIRNIEVATVVGGTEFSKCPGELVFRKGLKKYTLLPFSEGNEFFIIFADKTNGIETYGNGRFLYTTMPDSANKVILDFNKAYNPPCAFSPFATCPMPPEENILDLKIEAGEKEVHLMVP
jgi:uncharacterized protein (DUF1684 family)